MPAASEEETDDPARTTDDTARTILVAGTASHVGKSTVAAGLCRLLADRGVDVAPFKGQNMSNNARAVPRAEGSGAGTTGGPKPNAGEFGEVGVSQYVQAQAARVRASTDHNPVLLKPRGDGESQLVLDGEAVAHYAVTDYYDEFWDRARATAAAAHERLAADHDVVIAEGAGSIAEINLQHRDIANVETARFADADIVLVADIDRGGVFASLVGTLELLPDDLRDRVAGAIITKFRGDVCILQPGIAAFEERTGVPVFGVIPYDDPGLPAEDSVALPDGNERVVRGDDDGVDDDGVDRNRTVTIAVPRLPRVSNFTDLEPLAAEPGVRVAYVRLDTDLADADAVVLPGTKNTVDDLLAAREAGFADAIRQFTGPIVGLCGGYQLLGERIFRADVESTSDEIGEEKVAGFGLLPVDTTFSERKRVVATEWKLKGAGPLAGADGNVAGYEIHMGETRVDGNRDTEVVAYPFESIDGNGARDADGASLGAATDRVLGTYLHGLFENDVARDTFIENVYEQAERDRPRGSASAGSSYDRAADLLREHVDLGPLELNGVGVDGTR